MRLIGYVALFVLIALLTFLMLAPISFVLDRTRSSLPAIDYAAAEGSVWNGRIVQLRYGEQPVGNIYLQTDWLSVFSGALESQISITEGGVIASGNLSLAIDGSVTLRNVRVRGNTNALLSLKEEIRSLGGNFNIVIQELKLASGRCVRGSGQAETDILSRFEAQYDWKGPIMSGPLICRDNKLIIELEGRGEAGETVRSILEIDLSASGFFQTEIENGSDKIAQAATLLGFVTTGDKLVYEHSVRAGN